MTDLALSRFPGRGSGWAAPEGSAAARLSVAAEVMAGAAAYLQLAADWRRLAERQRGAVLFQAPDLLTVWAHHYAADRDASLVTVVVRTDDGRPLLIWPLMIAGRLLRVARGAGTPLGQYDEILLDPDCDAAEALAVAKAALVRAVRPDLVVLERVRADGALRAAIAAAVPLHAEAAPYSDLADGVASLMGHLKSRVTRQQRKRVRRFAEEGNVGFDVAEDGRQAEAWLAEAMALKRAWLSATGRVSRAFIRRETADCLADLARTLAPPGALPRMVVSRLALDGRTAAIEMGFRHGNTYHLYLGAFAPEFAKFGPGNILTEKVLEWCAANSITRYDMLAPRSRNKSEWQSAEVEVFDYALPTTIRGRFYLAVVLRRLVPAVRAAFYALPPTVRAPLAGLALRGLADRSDRPDAADREDRD